MAQEARSAAIRDSAADVRAREVEQQMTADERFSLLVSVCGETLVIPTPRDERIPPGTPMSSGYTPGVPRLGVPALLMSDASMGVMELPGLSTPWPPPDRFADGTPTTIRYDEGAEVGYRWFAKTGQKPRYAFGHGLSYTSFAYRDLEVEGRETLRASFTVTNTGHRAGADVPQLYLTEAVGDRRMRLLGFERVELSPGESKRVTITADPRLLARFDGRAARWRIAAGPHRVALGKAADDLVLEAEAPLTGRLFGS